MRPSWLVALNGSVDYFWTFGGVSRHLASQQLSEQSLVGIYRVKGRGMDNSLKMLLMEVQAGTFLVGMLASLTPDSILENLPHGSTQTVT